MTNQISDPNIYRNCISYNGESTPEGMVLVPVWITDEIFNFDHRIIYSNLITWIICGCRFRIGFAPIKRESFADYMNKFFWPELNEEIIKKCPDRCGIGMKSDDSPRICPKTNFWTDCDK